MYGLLFFGDVNEVSKDRKKSILDILSILETSSINVKISYKILKNFFQTKEFGKF